MISVNMNALTMSTMCHKVLNANLATAHFPPHLKYVTI